MTDPITPQDIADRLDRGDRRFEEIAEELRCLPQMQADMAAVREILEALQGLKTLGKVIMGISKPIMCIGAAAVSVWGFFKLAVIAATKGG